MKCILNDGPAQLEMGMQLNTKFEKGVGNVREYLTSLMNLIYILDSNTI